jgi:uncharacterized membrane protein
MRSFQWPLHKSSGNYWGPGSWGLVDVTGYIGVAATTHPVLMRLEKWHLSVLCSRCRTCYLWVVERNQEVSKPAALASQAHLQIGNNAGWGTLLERKLNLIQKDYDTAFACIARHASQTSTIRNWSITLTVAYVGVLIARESTGLELLLPAISLLGLLAILDTREQLFTEYTETCIRDVERIFMQQDPEAFTASVTQYEFRNLRIAREIPRRRDRWRRMLRRLAWPNVLCWYGALAFVILCAQMIARSMPRR